MGKTIENKLYLPLPDKYKSYLSLLADIGEGLLALLNNF